MLTCATGCNVFDTERKKLAPTARCFQRVSLLKNPSVPTFARKTRSTLFEAYLY
jgi:hypothetical protein